MTEHKAEVGMGGRRQWFDGSNMCQKVVDLWDLSIFYLYFTQRPNKFIYVSAINYFNRFLFLEI